MNYFFFFFNDTATTEIYTLSLHDALPIYHLPPVARRRISRFGDHHPEARGAQTGPQPQLAVALDPAPGLGVDALLDRSQHTVALQVGDVEVVARRGAL